MRTDPTSVNAVASVVAKATYPAAPQNVAVANPSDTLVARAAASCSSRVSLLSSVASLLVVGVGIANVMVIRP